MMEFILSLLCVVLFCWFMFGLLNPRAAAPFLKSPSRIKVVGIFLVLSAILGSVQAPRDNSSAVASAAQEKQIKTALATMETKLKSYEHDELLDDNEGNGSKGYRLKTDRGNVIAYFKDDKLYSLRWADRDLYKEGKTLVKLNDYLLTDGEFMNVILNLKSVIKTDLNDPDSAEFADYSEWRYKKTPEGILVKSWLRAKNAFGAKIKRSFVAELSPDGSNIRNLQWL